MISEPLARRRLGANPAQAVIDEMGQSGPLSASELEVVSELGLRPLAHAPYVDIQSPSAPTAEPFFILSGWAMRTRVLRDGRRQIIAFLLPGDFVGGLLKGCTITSMGQTTTANASEFLEKVERGGSALGGIARAMRSAADIERNWLLERIVRLGQLDAQSRLGHLFLELRHRLDRVGLAPNDEFALPVTQDLLAETVGLSMVHANRSIQQMRQRRLIELKGGRLRILERAKLQCLCDFTAPIEAARLVVD